MDKLYLSIKKAIDRHMNSTNFPAVRCDWEKGHIDQKMLDSIQSPLVLFKIQSIVFDCPEDKYLSGTMLFSVKLIFEAKELNAETGMEVYSGFDLLKKMLALLRTIESEETGPIDIDKMEVVDVNAHKHCFQITGTTSYYPPLIKS